MISSFAHAHPYYISLMAVVFLGVMGYVESRIFPSAPGVACLTWVWALLILTLGVARMPELGSFGVVLAAIALFGGGAWIAHYYKNRKGRGMSAGSNN